jgi:hypothetical protein
MGTLPCLRGDVNQDDTCICDSEVAHSIHNKALVERSPEVQWSHGCCTNGVEEQLQAEVSSEEAQTVERLTVIKALMYVLIWSSVTTEVAVIS